VVSPDDLPQGSYWQVSAVAQQQAEFLRTTLKDHGFPVVLSPGIKGLIRVLVGPYADTQAMGKAKTDLEAAGMHPLRYKP
jgi:cell division septation protein DedD